MAPTELEEIWVSAIFYGLRVSLGVGVLSGIFALIIGSFFGISAAFFGGKYESVVMRIVDIPQF